MNEIIQKLVTTQTLYEIGPKCHFCGLLSLVRRPTMQTFGQHISFAQTCLCHISSRLLELGQYVHIEPKTSGPHNFPSRRSHLWMMVSVDRFKINSIGS